MDIRSSYAGAAGYSVLHWFLILKICWQLILFVQFVTYLSFLFSFFSQLRMCGATSSPSVISSLPLTTRNKLAQIVFRYETIDLHTANKNRTPQTFEAMG